MRGGWCCRALPPRTRIRSSATVPSASAPVATAVQSDGEVCRAARDARLLRTPRIFTISRPIRSAHPPRPRRSFATASVCSRPNNWTRRTRASLRRSRASPRWRPRTISSDSSSSDGAISTARQRNTSWLSKATRRWPKPTIVSASCAAFEGEPTRRSTRFEHAVSLNPTAVRRAIPSWRHALDSPGLQRRARAAESRRRSSADQSRRALLPRRRAPSAGSTGRGDRRISHGDRSSGRPWQSPTRILASPCASVAMSTTRS